MPRERKKKEENRVNKWKQKFFRIHFHMKNNYDGGEKKNCERNFF